MILQDIQIKLQGYIKEFKINNRNTIDYDAIIIFYPKFDKGGISSVIRLAFDKDFYEIVSKNDLDKIENFAKRHKINIEKCSNNINVETLLTDDNFYEAINNYLATCIFIDTLIYPLTSNSI